MRPLTTILFAVAALIWGAPAGAADTELWRLDCGSIEVRNLGVFSDTFKYAGEKRTLTDSCYLVRHSKVDPISGDRDVFGDGSVVILSTPGHTPGETSLLVRLEKTGPVLLSGDVVHLEEQFANRGVPTFNFDRADTLASMERLIDTANSLDATLIVQHDASDIDKLPAFPKSAR